MIMGQGFFAARVRDQGQRGRLLADAPLPCSARWLTRRAFTRGASREAGHSRVRWTKAERGAGGCTARWCRVRWLTRDAVPDLQNQNLWNCGHEFASLLSKIV